LTRAQIAILIRPAAPEPSATGRARLSSLVWKLHDKGLDFRVISQRPDGLWDEDVYLTTADKTLGELCKWPVKPDLADKWKGTVAVMRRGPEGWETTVSPMAILPSSGTGT
jgi:hypothetical protein